jgi:hypothetical protein
MRFHRVLGFTPLLHVLIDFSDPRALADKGSTIERKVCMSHAARGRVVQFEGKLLSYSFSHGACSTADSSLLSSPVFSQPSMDDLHASSLARTLGSDHCTLLKECGESMA